MRFFFFYFVIPKKTISLHNVNTSLHHKMWLHANYSENAAALIFTDDWARHGDAFHSFQSLECVKKEHKAPPSLNNFELASKQV